MQNAFHTLDLGIFLFYLIGVAAYGYYVYCSKHKEQMNTKEYFLAEGSLTWWATGASMIASTISAEQFTAMSGHGFQVGGAVAAYGWGAAIVLIIVAVLLLGLFWKRTTVPAAGAGILAGFVLSALFNNYAPSVLGHETILYTAFPNGHGGYEIPFLICMGLSFAFTFAPMVGVSLASPAISRKAIPVEPDQFKVAPSTLALIRAPYAKFW